MLLLRRSSNSNITEADGDIGDNKVNNNIKVSQPLNTSTSTKSVNVFDKYKAEQNQSPDDILATFKARIGENRKAIEHEPSEDEGGDSSDDDW
jgi:hypothetical protein